jgi:hypothetical protein
MKRSLLPIVVFSLALPACASVTEPAPIAGSLIEIEYTNYAWVPTNRGFVIDGNGRVYSWDRAGKQWNPSDAENPTEAELTAKYEGKAQARTLPGGDASNMFALANTAASGSLSAPVNHCADAGETTISAWIPRGNGHMKRVLIRMEGDIVQENKSAAARSLAAKVDELALLPRTCID